MIPNKGKIRKAEDDVKNNEANQVTKKATIEAQKKALEDVKKLVENVK